MLAIASAVDLSSWRVSCVQNVFLTANDEAKIGDFGITKVPRIIAPPCK